MSDGEVKWSDLEWVRNAVQGGNGFIQFSSDGKWIKKNRCNETKEKCIGMDIWNAEKDIIQKMAAAGVGPDVGPCTDDYIIMEKYDTDMWDELRLIEKKQENTCEHMYLNGYPLDFDEINTNTVNRIRALKSSIDILIGNIADFYSAEENKNVALCFGDFRFDNIVLNRKEDGSYDARQIDFDICSDNWENTLERDEIVRLYKLRLALVNEPRPNIFQHGMMYSTEILNASNAYKRVFKKMWNILERDVPRYNRLTELEKGLKRRKEMPRILNNMIRLTYLLGWSRYKDKKFKRYAINSYLDFVGEQTDNVFTGRFKDKNTRLDDEWNYFMRLARRQSIPYRYHDTYIIKAGEARVIVKRQKMSGAQKNRNMGVSKLRF